MGARQGVQHIGLRWRDVGVPDHLGAHRFERVAACEQGAPQSGDGNPHGSLLLVK